MSEVVLDRADCDQVFIELAPNLKLFVRFHRNLGRVFEVLFIESIDYNNAAQTLNYRNILCSPLASPD
jgi:hypothetical protein